MGGAKQKWKCATCNKEKTNKDHSVKCFLCKEFSGLECTSYEQEIYDYLHSEEVEINWICKSCKETIPDLMNLRECLKKQAEQQNKNNIKITKCKTNIEALTAKQNQILSEISSLNVKITNLENEKEKSSDIDIQGLNERISTLEAKTPEEPDPSNNTKDLEKTLLKKVDEKLEEVGLGPEVQAKYAEIASFPPLEIKKNFEEVQQKQARTQKFLDENIKAQKEDKDEQARIESKRNNLIAYGLPETEATKEKQKFSDFNTIKELYQERVDIKDTDIIDLQRIGKSKENSPRPLRIIFKENELRNEVLKNNKYLKLEGENFKECTCKFPGQHIHIYITDDKTKKQQEADKILRDELKQKRQNGEIDLIIRNGKIVSKKRSTGPRWIEICDGFY